MKILFLHSSSDLYGASKILLAVTQLCKESNHEITVVLSEKGMLADQFTELGIEVIYIDLAILRRQYLSFGGLLNRASTGYKAYLRLKQLCKERHFNLIYSNTTAVIVGFFVASTMRLAHIWHVHEIIEKPAALFRMLSWLLNKKINRIITVSKSVNDHWSKYVDPKKMTIIYNGIEYWLFENKESNFRLEQNISADAVLIGMVGRVHFWKGQDYFLKIAGQIHLQFPELIFVSVGDSFSGYEYLYKVLDGIISEENLTQVVKQVPFRADILNVYNALDIFVLPSQLPDPAPLVVGEAMACGLPVVATKQGGAVEFIEDGVSGILIPLNDAKAAAKKITPLITNLIARKKMGNAARERVVNHFSRKNFNQQILHFIEQR
jgi:glycosyltransferase involved in cell wall biosynthesis